MGTSANSSSGDNRRLALVLLPLVVPWTVVVHQAGVDYVFAWGLMNPSPLRIVTVYEYVFVYTNRLTQPLLAWPTAVVVYGMAIVSAASGVLLGWEDTRVTAGLLAIAGISQASFSFGIGRPDLTAIPVGSILLWAIAWIVYARR